MWAESKFEERMRLVFDAELGGVNGQSLYADYLSARKILLEDVLSEIRGAEPALSDHGPDHIHNVLENVHALLPRDESYFNAKELYLLGLSVLFHDVGNVEGRKDHNKRIGKFYNYVRSGQPERWAAEMHLVVKASEAHTGLSSDGTRDTLKDVPESHHWKGDPIRLRMIASVVRFADELAEGKQRTSLYLRANNKYPPNAKIHHDYAAVTSVAIDRGNGRVALTYHPIYESCGRTHTERLTTLGDLLSFIYGRIAKLDQERKYARFYCPELLLPFRETSVEIAIQANGEFQELGLKPIRLSDIVVPGGEAMTLPQVDSAYDPSTITQRLGSTLQDCVEDAPVPVPRIGLGDADRPGGERP